MTVNIYMSRQQTQNYRSHTNHGIQAVSVAASLFLFGFAIWAGVDGEMNKYLWFDAGLVLVSTAIAAAYLSAAGRVVRNVEITRARAEAEARAQEAGV